MTWCWDTFRLYGGYAGDDLLFGNDGNDQLWGLSGDRRVKGRQRQLMGISALICL